MTLEDIIEMVSDELPNSDDDKIVRWVQNSIDYILNTLPLQHVQITDTLTTTASTQTVDLPSDFSELLDLAYTPGDNSGFVLTYRTPEQWRQMYIDQTGTSQPEEYTIIGDKIYLSPIPDSTYTLNIRYKQGHNVFLHEVLIADDDNAASTGVQVYIDEDATETGVGKLYAVLPGATDIKARIMLADRHYHDVTVYHSANAATLGVALYIDYDIVERQNRLLFVSPTGANTVAKTDISRGHSHYLKIVDDDNAASSGVAIYIDEDAANKGRRLLFVSPGDVDGRTRVVLSKDETLPPLLERFHEAITLLTVSKGHFFNKNVEQGRESAGRASAVLRGLQTADARRNKGAVLARTFSSSGAIYGDYWANPFIKRVP